MSPSLALLLLAAGQDSAQAKDAEHRLGNLVVKVSNVRTDAASDGGLTLVMLVTATNAGKEPMPYLDWMSRRPERRPNADKLVALLTADGVPVKVIGSTADHPKSIPPGRSISVGLEFLKLPAGHKELILTLPGETVGQQGELKITLPLPKK